MDHLVVHAGGEFAGSTSEDRTDHRRVDGDETAGEHSPGRPGDVDGDISKTNINSPWDLCHANGTLFIAMAGPHQIW